MAWIMVDRVENNQTWPARNGDQKDGDCVHGAADIGDLHHSVHVVDIEPIVVQRSANLIQRAIEVEVLVSAASIC